MHRCIGLISRALDPIHWPHAKLVQECLQPAHTQTTANTLLKLLKTPKTHKKKLKTSESSCKLKMLYVGQPPLV